MIQVIAGEKGSGKTKEMIANANEFVKQSKGHVIYLGNNTETMYELSSTIRLIDTSQFEISSVDMFIGFLYGTISEDYDIECIYIDNVNCLTRDEESILRFVNSLRAIGEKFGIKFVLGIKAPRDRLPDIEIEYIAV